jgi:peptide/nickel transport system permease protein
MIGNERAEAATVVRADTGLLARGVTLVTSVARFGRRKPLGAIGGAIVVVLILIAIMAPALAPYGPRSLEGRVHESPNSRYLLGTDHLGRDLLSRIIYGARISLYVGLGSVVIGITGSFILGVATAYAGGAIDLSFQRLIDAMMALPGLIIALAIMAVLGASLNNVIIAIVIGVLAPVVRTVRSQVLSLRELDYVTAARAVGCSGLRIVLRHIVPNCLAIYLILATYYLGAAIIIEASLSFLGVGAPPDNPSWGGILTRSTEQHIKAGWWVGIFPGVTIFVVVLGFNLLGDALRDIFDPKLRGR